MSGGPRKRPGRSAITPSGTEFLSMNAQSHGCQMPKMKDGRVSRRLFDLGIRKGKQRLDSWLLGQDSNLEPFG